MAPPAERPAGLTNLQKRILSAAVLLPLVVAAIYFGHPVFHVADRPICWLAAWEWTRSCWQRADPGAQARAGAKTAGWVLWPSISIACRVGL